MNTQMETGLVPSVSVTNLVAVRMAIRQKIEEASALLVEVETLIEANRLDPLRYCLGEWGHGGKAEVSLCRGHTAEAHRYVDAQFWSRLLDESGLKTFMNSTRRKEWSNQINECNVPEFTPDNVASTFAEIHSQRGNMVTEGVVEIFQRLSWCYKTNNPRMFGKKIIMNYFFVTRSGWSSFHGDACNKLDDLTRVFYIVNGEPEPDHRTGTEVACDEARRAGKSTLETKYLKLRWYKKGSVHIEFKDLEGVAAMNRMIAKAFPCALPPV